MKAARLSVGRLPFYAIQATMGCCALMMGALWWHTHRHGPAVTISGLKAPAILPIHSNDAEYAVAIATRFVHEYWNWSYSGLLQAKARAAYFCRGDIGTSLMAEARASAHYYQELLDTCNGAILACTVTWADERRSHYLVHLSIAVQEWQSFAHTAYTVDGFIEVRPIVDQGDRQFRMEVVRSRFAQVTTPRRIDDTGADDLMTQLLHAAQDAPPTTTAVPGPSWSSAVPRRTSPAAAPASIPVGDTGVMSHLRVPSTAPQAQEAL